MRLDALIFGGGAAGLWLLDRLSRDGRHVLLLEANALGAGQTVASQGIIHGCVNYTLPGLSPKSVKNFRDMPQIWRDSLSGQSIPDLSHTRLRSSSCYLWQADALLSRSTLRIASPIEPELVSNHERPAVFEGVFGTIARISEQVISPRSFIQDLAAQYHDRILKIDAKQGLEFELDSPGEVTRVILKSPEDGSRLELHPRQVILTAGAGNGRLRKLAGLSADVMQRRPMHMVLARGLLPELNGYCLNGASTRVAITSELDEQNRRVWQIGGQLAEEGVKLSPAALTEKACAELTQVLPCVNFRETEWSTYLVERAEGATPGGTRPDNIQVLCAGNVTTGWPTKLVLAPALAQEIANRASSPYLNSAFDTSPFADWPRPAVASLPWEEQACAWWTLKDGAAGPARRAA